jgi:SAM-dependent methyltransferase
MKKSKIDEIPNKEVVIDYAATLPSAKTRHLPLSFYAIGNYLTGRVTPARLLNDIAIADLMPNLIGDIIEIGATKYGNHKRFSNRNNRYVLSNISKEEGCIYLDAMNMFFSNNSVDNFVSAQSLEHMPDPWKAINEINRTLKPGGKLLLVVPFMFPYHAAPSDFFRFSDKGLEVMLKKFRVVHVEALGNIFSTCALFLQRPFGWSRRPFHRNNLARKIQKAFTISINVLCRLVGLFLYLISYTIRYPDDYAFLYCFLAEKQE